jgi:hypothetical protein
VQVRLIDRRSFRADVDARIRALESKRQGAIMGENFSTPSGEPVQIDAIDLAPATNRTNATRARRRAAIDAALRADPDRTDNAIAIQLGVDPKTVKARRAETANSQHAGLNFPIGNFDEPNSQHDALQFPTIGKSGRNSQPNSQPNSQHGKFEAANSPVGKFDTANSPPPPPPSSPIAPKPDHDRHFDWSADVVAVPEQRAIAIYRNANGDLAIRQEGWPDDDDLIVIAAHCENEFIERLNSFIQAD